MIVTYENDADLRDKVPGDGVICTFRNRVVCRFKDKAFASGKIESKLTGTITLQGMGPPGTQFRHVFNRTKVGQPGAQLSTAIIAEFFGHDPLLFTKGL